MTFDCKDQALKDYIKICRTEDRETFLLDQDFNIIFCNEPAIQQCGELASDYFKRLLEDGQGKLESILNRDRYAVYDDLVNDRIALLYRMDIPSMLPYYELTLWEKQPAVQSTDHSIEKLSHYAKALAGSGGCPRQLITQFQREAFLFTTHQALLNGLYDDIGHVGLERIMSELFSKAEKIAAMRGVQFDYYDLYFGKIYGGPICLAHILVYIFSALLYHSLPGDCIAFNGDLKTAFSIKLQLNRFTVPENFAEIAGFDITVAKQITKYMGGTMITEEDQKTVGIHIEIPLSYFTADLKGKKYFDMEPDLLNAVSTCVCTDKIRPFALSDDFLLNWSVFPQEIDHEGTIAACIQSIQDRLNSMDYRDLYGNHIKFNLAVITYFSRYLYINQERLAGVSKNKSIYNNPQKVPRETYEKIADVYGLKAENLSAPNFILNIMAGRNLADEKMACADRSGAALLVFDQLQSECLGFQTGNSAFNVCREAMDSDSRNIALWVERGMESIRKAYFDQSIPISEKIGNNLTILRLLNQLTIDEAAARADINPDKLKALEAGNIEHAYCRDLDRLCRVYQADTPPGLFINGYALTVLWRRDFIRYGMPPTLCKQYPGIVHEFQHYDYSVEIYEKRRHVERDYSAFLESSLPVVFIDENQTPIRRNEAARKRRIGLNNNSDPILDIFHSQIILWAAGKEIILSPGNPSYPKIYLFEVNRFGLFRLTMAIYDMDGTVDPEELAKAAGLLKEGRCNE